MPREKHVQIQIQLGTTEIMVGINGTVGNDVTLNYCITKNNLMVNIEKDRIPTTQKWL